MGLRNPCDSGPAHHHHHHRNAARRRLCDNHCQRHQDHRHLRSGHHPKEGEAVNTDNRQNHAGLQV